MKRTTEAQRKAAFDLYGIDLTCEQWDRVLQFCRDQPTKARAMMDGQPISESDTAIEAFDEEALNVAARGAAD